MRAAAEASFDQARKAFEKFVSSAQATAGSIENAGRRSAPAPGMSAPRRSPMPRRNAGIAGLCAIAAARQGPGRNHAAAQRICAGQMRSLAEQASEMGQIISRAAMDAAKPKLKARRTGQVGGLSPGSPHLLRSAMRHCTQDFATSYCIAQIATI